MRRQVNCDPGLLTTLVTPYPPPHPRQIPPQTV